MFNLSIYVEKKMNIIKFDLFASFPNLKRTSHRAPSRKKTAMAVNTNKPVDEPIIEQTSPAENHQDKKGNFIRDVIIIFSKKQSF